MPLTYSNEQDNPTLIYGGGWNKLLAILARDDVSEIKIDAFQDGVFVINKGINVLVKEIYWGNRASFFSDFEAVVFPSMHASGFEDSDGRPMKPHLLRYLYEGGLEYAFTDSHGARKTVHARLHAVLPPIVDSAPAITIAKRSENLTTMESMIKNGTMNEEIADFLCRAVQTKQTMVLSAGSGCGKTTLLRILGQYFDPAEHLIVAEDSPELSFLNVKDAVYMQSVPWRPGISKNEEVTLEYVVSLMLRMRPNRIIVGESRSKEFYGFLLASNSGVRGSMTTLHANSSRECLEKMAMLATGAAPTLDLYSLNKVISSGVDFIIQLDKDNYGHHWVEEIAEVSNTVSTETNSISTATVFKHHPNGAFENLLNKMSDVKRRELGYLK